MEEYSFKKDYRLGEIIFYTNLEESVVIKIRLRTVNDTYMVGVVDKGGTVFIGKDKISRIFRSFIDAKDYLDSLGKEAILEIIQDTPEQLEKDGDGNENKVF